MRLRLFAWLVAAAVGLAMSAMPAAPVIAAEKDLKTVAAETGLLKRMAEIKTLAGLDGASTGGAKLTIFAPSDAAFEALPAHIRDRLLAPENRTLLVDVLLHHAVVGKFTTMTLIKPKPTHYGIEAVDGTLIEFTTRRHIDVHGAKMVLSDIQASNGVLHVIDKVLIPDHVMAALEGKSPDRQFAAQ